MANVTVNGNDYVGVNEVQLPLTGGGGKQTFVLPPSGVKEISANGTYDVAGFASAEVNVAAAVSGVPFEVSGNPVTCQPIAGSALSVTAMVQAVERLDWVRKEGATTQTGTPAPSAPIPLVDNVPAGSYYVPSTAPSGGYWKIDLAEALGGIGDYRDSIEVDAYTGAYRIIKKTHDIFVTRHFSQTGSYYNLLPDGSAPLASGNSSRYWSNAFAAGKFCGNISRNIVYTQTSMCGLSYAELNALVDTMTTAGNPLQIKYVMREVVTTTGQAVRVTSTSGLTALNAVSMGLTEADADHPASGGVPESVTVTHNGVTKTVNTPTGFTGGAVTVSGIVAVAGENILSVDVGYLIVSGVTASGGGVTVQTATGTFQAPGNNSRAVVCGFVPDLVVIGLPEGYTEGSTPYVNRIAFDLTGAAGDRIGVTLVGDSSDYHMYGCYCEATANGFTLGHPYWQDFNGDYGYDTAYTLTYTAIKYT